MIFLNPPFLTGGKLAVVGSGAMFSDQYIDKEDNSKIKVHTFTFTSTVSLNQDF